MAGVLSGNTAFVKILHPLDSEDADVVGPGAYTLKSTATFDSTAKFGNSLLCDANGESLDADSAISSFDLSDTAKTIYHFFWRTTTLAVQQGHVTWQNSASSLFKSRIFFNAAGTRIRIEWIRATDISPGNPAICVDSLGGKFSTGVFASVVGYINAAGISEGKIFKDGVDITDTIQVEASPTRGTTGFDNLRLGNNFNGLDPARFTDHVTIVQDSSFSDTKAVSLATNYSDTRGFGFNPTFTVTDITKVKPRDVVNLTGTGFGKDVNIKVGGKDAFNIVRLSESLVSFQVPRDVDFGILDLAIINVSAGVTFTELKALSHERTIWTSGGLSDRVLRFGDGFKFGEDLKFGDPTPFCDPNVSITTWTREGLEP